MPKLIVNLQNISYYSYTDQEGELWLDDSRSLEASKGLTSFSDSVLDAFCESTSYEDHPSSISNVFSFRRFWLAKDGDKVVGRIALFARNSANLSLFVPFYSLGKGLDSKSQPQLENIDEAALEEPPPVTNKSKRAFFGFFYLADGAVDAGLKLLEIVHLAAKNQGFLQLDGPMSIHPFIGFGIVSKGVGPKPIFHQPRNRTTLNAITTFFENNSFQSSVHRFQIWDWRSQYGTLPLAVKLAESTKVHEGLRFRRFDPDDDDDLEAIVNIYNDAYEKLPNFTPLTFLEVHWFLHELEIVDPRCSTLVELDGEPIAVVLAAENLKPIEILSSEHMLGELPKRIYRMLTGKRVTLRIIMIAVRRAYRGSAVGALPVTLWHELIQCAVEAGYEHLIMPPINFDDRYHNHASELLKLRKERDVKIFITRF